MERAILPEQDAAWFGARSKESCCEKRRLLDMWGVPTYNIPIFSGVATLLWQLDSETEGTAAKIYW